MVIWKVACNSFVCFVLFCNVLFYTPSVQKNITTCWRWYWHFDLSLVGLQLWYLKLHLQKSRKNQTSIFLDFDISKWRNEFHKFIFSIWFKLFYFKNDSNDNVLETTIMVNHVNVIKIEYISRSSLICYSYTNWKPFNILTFDFWIVRNMSEMGAGASTTS